MALDLTTDPQPAFAAVTGAGTTATQIRAIPHSTVVLYASGAIFAFNGVADGGTAPGATARKAFSATQAGGGMVFVVGGAGPGTTYGTICVAAQTGTVDLEAYSVPPERVS